MPFIGHLFFKLYFSGTSSDRGFCVKREGLCIAQSQGFDSGKEHTDITAQKAKRIYLVVGFVSLVSFVPLVWLTGNPLWLKAIWFLAMFIPIELFSILIAFQLAFRQERNFREYHAVEHKVCILLGEKLEPTLGSLRRMPKTSIFCGSALVSILLSFPFLFGFSFFLSYGKVEQFDHLTFLKNVLTGIAVWSTFILSFFSQLLFFVKEPRESILFEGLDVAKKAQEAIKSAT